MTNDNFYGFESTNEVEFDSAGLPVGTYKVMAVSEEADEKGRGVIVEYEVVEGDFKGKRGKVWYLTKHESAQTANIAKQNLKRLAEATKREISSSNPIKGRVMVLTVAKQKKNPDYTEIKKYHPADYVAADHDIPFA